MTPKAGSPRPGLSRYDTPTISPRREPPQQMTRGNRSVSVGGVNELLQPATRSQNVAVKSPTGGLKDRVSPRSLTTSSSNTRSSPRGSPKPGKEQLLFLFLSFVMYPNNEVLLHCSCLLFFLFIFLLSESERQWNKEVITKKYFGKIYWIKIERNENVTRAR